MLSPLGEDSPRRPGPYPVRARPGAGAMDEVLLGDRLDGSGPAAVKTVRREVARDDGFRRRFRREIAVARSVTGPHAAPLLDGDTDAEVPWFATAYVAGPTAVRRVAEGRSVTGPYAAPLLDGDTDAEVPWFATAYVAGPTPRGRGRGEDHGRGGDQGPAGPLGRAVDGVGLVRRPGATW